MTKLTPKPKAFIPRLGHWVYRRLSIWVCILIACAAYLVSWSCTLYRLTNTEMRAKFIVSAALIGNTADKPASTPEQVNESIKRIKHIIKKSIQAGNWDNGMIEKRFDPDGSPPVPDEFLKHSMVLSETPEADASFIHRVTEWNRLVYKISQVGEINKPFTAKYTGEYPYQDFSIGIPFFNIKSIRESALLYLRYSDYFYSISKNDDEHVVYPVSLILASNSTISTEVNWGELQRSLRSIPNNVLANPWELIRYHDPNFAELCSGIPLAVLSLLLAVRFIAGIWQEPDAAQKLFEAPKTNLDKPARYLLALPIAFSFVVLCVEGRETWIEIFRLPFMFLTAFAVSLLIYILIDLNHRDISQSFRSLSFESRKKASLPFLVGALALFLGCCWSIYYSIFALLPQLNLGAYARAIIQIIFSLVVIYLLLRLAFKIQNAKPTQDAEQTKDDFSYTLYYNELFKALLIFTPAVIKPILEHLAG